MMSKNYPSLERLQKKIDLWPEGSEMRYFWEYFKENTEKAIRANLPDDLPERHFNKTVTNWRAIRLAQNLPVELRCIDVSKLTEEDRLLYYEEYKYEIKNRHFWYNVIIKD